MGAKGECIKMKIFSLMIREDMNFYYGEFYDIPCFVSGKSVNEIIEKAQKVLNIYYNEMKLTGQVISAPTDYEIVKSKKNNEMVIPITIDDTTNNSLYKKEKSIKKNVTIPDWLNQLAIKYKIPFSETLKLALIEAIKNKIR